jgi:cytosine/uracil/thiamine/allantoin permease
LLHPLEHLKGAISFGAPALGVALILSRPATAASAARWARAYGAFVTTPTDVGRRMLNTAARNLSATAADQIGVNIDPNKISAAPQQ